MFKTLTSLLLIFLFLVPAVASTVRELNWDDLISSAVVFDDPFAEMERDELENLGFVARVRGLIAAGNTVSQETRVEAAEIEAELINEGIDVDSLLARRDEIRDLRKKRAGAVVIELDGASVKMPGYALPLEYDGMKVKEFLLVPWVGACIHTPPPPPNQIVYVKLKKGIENAGGFTPVWVTGEMKVKAATKNLYLVDGSAGIDVGYSLEASRVEPYKSK